MAALLFSFMDLELEVDGTEEMPQPYEKQNSTLKKSKQGPDFLIYYE